jgi:phosphatidate cytidylyltransferase
MAAARRAREPRRKGTSDLLPRILVAIPAIAFAVVIIWQGGWVFAAGVGALARWRSCACTS